MVARELKSAAAVAVLACATVLGAASSLAAQCTTIDPPCPDEGPAVSITPSGGTYSVSDIEFQFYLSDDRGLDAASFQESHSGATVLSGSGPTYNSSKTSGAGSRVIRLAPGTNTVTITICDTNGTCASNSATYTYDPPAPPPDKGPPTISTAPHNGDNRDPIRCVAECFEKTLGYAAPAYVSLDVARSVTLFYSAAQVLPYATVQVDATDNSVTPPSMMSIRIREGTTYLTLEGVPGGADELFFAQGVNGTSRLGARFGIGTKGTGAYDYTAVVRSHWSDAVHESETGVRVLVLREASSPYGHGWSIAGLQRIIVQGNGLAVTGGDGSIAFFANCATGCNTYVSPRGDFTTLTKRSDGGGYDRTWPNGTKVEFNAQGLMTGVVDRYGNRTSYGYTGTPARLVSITDPIGLVTTLGYDGAGKLDYIRDPGGRTTDVTVNTAGDLTQIADPDGVVALRITYDANHVLASYTDRTGGLWTLTHDWAGKLSQVDLPTVTADGASVRPQATFRSLERQVLLDGSGSGTSSSPAPRRISADLRAKIFDPRGDSTVFALNGFGQATRMEYRDPQGKWQVATAEYNVHGQPTSVTTVPNQSMSYAWSGPLLISVTDHNQGQRQRFAYELTYSQVREVWLDDLGDGTSFKLQENVYGTQGRLEQIIVGTDTAFYTSDARGRLRTAKDFQKHETSLVYHTTGTQNLLSVTAPTGSGTNGTTTYGYDTHGRVASVTDPASRVVTTAYDAVNRVTSTTAPEQTTTLFGYDDVNRVYTVTDPKTQIYKQAVNALGWVETLTDPRNQVERFAYDKNGNVRTYTNRRGQQVQFDYDQRNRVVSITADGKTTSFAYDTSMTWVAASNDASTDTLELDPDGRVTQAVTRRGALRYVLTSTYDRKGWRNTLKVTGPWGTRDLGFGHDAFFRFSNLKDSRGLWTQITYNKDHLPETVTFPTGSTKLQERLSYTPGHLPAGIGFNIGAVEVPLGRRYTYDVLGRVTTSRRGQDPADGIYGDVVKRYVQYDALGRLSRYDDVHEWQEQGELVCPTTEITDCYYETIYHSDTLRTDTFTYDKVGNRTDKGAVLEAGNRLTAFNGFTLQYDADGNLTRKVKSGVTDQVLTWNSRGQLIQIDEQVGTPTVVDFGYDAFGRRVRKQVRQFIGGIWRIEVTQYLWDGDDLAVELDGAGNPIREYASYPGVDRPHSVRRSSDGAVFYYTNELPGHVTGLVNTSNQVVNRYEYTPWGEPITTSEQVVQPLRYAAREYDAETKLYYVRARYYDPALGRFISEDPIGLAGGINPCVYAGNDPVNHRDPTGLDCVTYVLPGTEVCTTFNGKTTCEERPPEITTVCTGGGRGGGGGSGGSGFPDGGGLGGGGGPAPRSLGPEGPSCGREAWEFVRKFAFDAVGGSLLRAFVLARRARAGMAAAGGLVRQGRVFAAAGENLGHAWSAGAGIRTFLAHSAMQGAALDELVRGTASLLEAAAGVSDLSAMELLKALPVLGSGFELGEALNACTGGFFAKLGS
ncbi:MAG TPA: RHS repeat-associated core domain-containing protein [Gemmatimonadales bacterium]|nr:RHS repeat-associated core domain-containing protein [Gemmatimonadales bacterium]